MITKLTEKQKKLIPVYQKKWYNQFHSLSFDEEKARGFVKWLYKLIHKKEPLIVILDSPMAVQLAVNLLKADKKLGSQLRSQLRSQLGSQLHSQLDSQLDSQLHSQLHSQLSSQLHSQLDSQLRSQLDSQLRSQLSSQLHSQELNYYPFDYWGDTSWFGYLCFYDFIYHELFPEVKIPIFEEYIEYSKANINFLLTFEGITFISKPPVFINFGEKGRLDCKTDKAIYYSDGYGLHFVNGVFFGNELFNKGMINKSLTGEDIISLKNAEQKAVLIQHYGYENILKSLPELKVIDEVNELSKVDGKPVKYQLLEFKIDNVVVRVVRVEDHSVHKVTCLGVPIEKQTENCKGAIAWTFGLTVKDYVPEVES